MKVSRRDMLVGAAGATVGVAGAALLASVLKPTSTPPTDSRAIFRVDHSHRIVEANGLPGHAVGDFPNAHDPMPLRAQTHKLRMPMQPTESDQPIPIDMWWFGVAVNGIPFDPSGPFWNGEPTSGWQFEVLHPANAIALGIDHNNAHTQIGGMYHYHGMPAGLLWQLLSREPRSSMLLVGYAADGYPIYGPECPADPLDPHSPIRRLRPGYRLADSKRQGGPGGRPDGRFVEDYLYDAQLGDLDQCNGRFGLTPEHPDGTYHYVLTDCFPHIPRYFHGQPDKSFAHGPPLGVSAPMPAELRRYRPV